MDLNQIFNRTLASPANQDKLEVETKQRKPDKRKVPVESNRPVNDSVVLSSGGGSPVSFTYQASNNESTVGLPSLSRGYTSYTGGLLDVVA